MRKAITLFVALFLPAAVLLAVWQVTAFGVALIRDLTFPGPLQTGTRLIGIPRLILLMCYP